MVNRGVPESGTGVSVRITAAIVLSLLLVAAAAGVGVIFMTGAVRFGTPGVSDFSTASSVSSRGTPRQKRDTFTQTDARIYCCCRVTAYEDTVVEARWFLEGRRLESYALRFWELAGSRTGRFVTSSANAAFRLDRPQEGWTSGNYRVEVLLDGNKGASADFDIASGEGEESDTRLYRDPGGRFSVRYPLVWEPADPSSLEGALAGFLAPGAGPYEPRFAVVLTDFSSASPEYLNGILVAQGVGQEEFFGSYTARGGTGARRSFTWEKELGGRKYRLKSIQVVLKGKSNVYSLDCHCLEQEAAERLPTFDSIIESFRVYD